MVDKSISKDNILRFTTPANIYARFLNLAELPKGNFSSPFSEDKKPSFRIYNNGTFKCFSSGKQGDVFGFVAELNQLDCATQFPEVLKLIAKETNMAMQANTFSNASPQVNNHKKKNMHSANEAQPLFYNASRNGALASTDLQGQHDAVVHSVIDIHTSDNSINGEHTALARAHVQNARGTLQGQNVGNAIAEIVGNIPIDTVIPDETDVLHPCKVQSASSQVQVSHVPFAIKKINHKDMPLAHLEFWEKLGVPSEILQTYFVRAVADFTFYSEKKEKDVTWKIFDYLAFSYDVNGRYEVYIPNQPDKKIKKFFCNGLLAEDVFGFNQLPDKIQNIVICAGKKDAVVAASRGFFAVSFRSENHLPSATQIQELQSRCDQMFICYDNDKGGEAGAQKILSKYPQISRIVLPKEINDVADYFQIYSSENFQNLISEALINKSPVLSDEVKEPEEKQLTTIIHITEDYLNEQYNIRHNIIANEIEITRKEKNEWKELNENSLWIEMQKKNIKVPASTLEKILKSDFVEKFNPLIAYFENLPLWDKKTDYITQYADYIKLSPDEDKEQYNYHFKKWCVRAVKCATDDNYFNKNAFVISDEGKGQNIGKTTWIRNLCPQILSNYLKDDLPKDEKDAKIALTQNFIVNLDELASLSRQEINTLKSLFSADKIKVRFPYDKREIVVRRVANFIGSTNLSTFLHDETGSVRWLCFVADRIDFSYKKDFDINNLWSQAYALSLDKNFDETITSIDMSVNELRNAKFQIQSPEKDLICRFLEMPMSTEETQILTSTEIQQYLAGFAHSIKLNNNAIGKALTSMKFRKIRSSTTTKYAVKYKDLID